MANQHSPPDRIAATNKSRSKEEVLTEFLNELCFWEVENADLLLRGESTRRGGNRRSRRELAAASQNKKHNKNNKRDDTDTSSTSDQSSRGQSPTHSWKRAVDPVSGKTYYYHTVTRVTQWEKPAEIKALERKKRKEKLKQAKSFFLEMEANIRASLKRGELIPSIALADTEKQGPPQEPLLPMSRPPAVRVRTISGMNEDVLTELRDDRENSARGAATLVVPRPPMAPVLGLPPSEGRPPLPNRRNGNSPPKRGDSFQLSPEMPSRGSAGCSSSNLKGQHQQQIPSAPQSETDALQGEFLLDDPILDEDAADQLDLNAKNTQLPVARPPSLTSHQRRNTGGTIFVKSTMENPDIKTTIQCVCGVYRAHIEQSLTRKQQRSPVSTMNIDLDVFRDDYERTRRLDSFSLGMLPVPSLNEIESFYQKFFEKSQMEHDTIIMSLIYVERLIKETDGKLTPSPENWASILFSCMILASKVWDDLSMWNIDFSHVSFSPGMSPFSLKRINQLEIAVLTSLNFNVKVPASEYAKYYFLIRTMLTRSGLLEHANVPLNKEEGAKVLESRTSRYQENKLEGGRHDRERARSFDYNCLTSSSSRKSKSTGPVLNDNACLEQLVSMK